MKIEDLVSGKREEEIIQIRGVSVPVWALKRLSGEGYSHVRPYPENKTLSLWGKTCSGCFTEEELKEKG